MINLKEFYDKYNHFENLLNENNVVNTNDIISEIKNDQEIIAFSKKLVNQSKSILIKINKSNNLLKIKKDLESNINHLIYQADSIEKINEIKKLYKDYYEIDYDKLLLNIQEIVSKSKTFDDLSFLIKINNKKQDKNNLEKLIDSSYYNQNKVVYFDHVLVTEEEISTFIKKFHYQLCDKAEYKRLKRGFIFEVSKFNLPYIVKLQPNLSFIEIIMNIYLSKYKQFESIILFPDYIFLNKNNSYFTITKKYTCDLFEYSSKKIIHIHQIIRVFQFLIKSIYELHKLDIIYGDVKLENIILNHKNNEITDLRLIDFDVSIFDTLPKAFSRFNPEIKKLFENKKPRGSKFYMCSHNEIMTKGNDIYSIGVFIIILLYKNTLKLIKKNKELMSDVLFTKIKKKLIYFKNKLEDDSYKIKLIQYIYRIYNDKRFKQYWDHTIPMKEIYTIVKKCLKQEVTSEQLHLFFQKSLIFSKL
jgi:serine/threonine protein kinase